MIDKSYYTSAGKKVGDFCIGFFGSLAVVGILTGIFSTSQFLLSSLGAVSTIIGSLFSLAIFGGTIWGIIVLFKKRMFISLGILTAVVALPLLVFGACLVILSSSGF